MTETHGLTSTEEEDTEMGNGGTLEDGHFEGIGNTGSGDLEGVRQ